MHVIEENVSQSMRNTREIQKKMLWVFIGEDTEEVWEGNRPWGINKIWKGKKWDQRWELKGKSIMWRSSVTQAWQWENIRNI